MRAEITRDTEDNQTPSNGSGNEEEKALAEIEAYKSKERAKSMRTELHKNAALSMQRDNLLLEREIDNLKVPESSTHAEITPSTQPGLTPEEIKSLEEVKDDKVRETVARTMMQYKAFTSGNPMAMMPYFLEVVTKGGANQDPIEILSKSIDLIKKLREEAAPPVVSTQPTTPAPSLADKFKDKVEDFALKLLEDKILGKNEPTPTAPPTPVEERRDFEFKEKYGMVVPKDMTYEEAKEMNKELREVKKEMDKEEKADKRFESVWQDLKEQTLPALGIFANAAAEDFAAKRGVRAEPTGPPGQPARGGQNLASDGTLTCTFCSTKIPVSADNPPEEVKCPNWKNDGDGHLHMRPSPKAQENK